MKTIPLAVNESGSMGFSEAWPQPAQTACAWNRRVVSGKTINHAQTRRRLAYVAFVAARRRDDQVDVGVVVVV